MSPPSRPSSDLEALVSQLTWTRGLALAVARDATLADDLAQDAVVAALEHRPDTRRPLGAWMKTVMANVLRKRRAENDARARREAQWARPELQDDHVQALVRIETQEALLRAVRELDEPYRSTVIARWFDGLEPLEIARRGGLPVRTVHTRLARGLEMLRERLDRRSKGGRAEWLSAWIPLLPTARSLPWILAMDVKLKLVLTGAALAGALCLWFVFPRQAELEGRGLAPAPSRDAALEGQSHAADAIAAVELGAARERIVDGAQPASAVAAPAKPRLRGRVIDASGAGVELPLVFVPKVPDGHAIELESDGSGRFECDVPPSDGTLAPRDENWTSVLEPRISLPVAERDYVLVVAPRIALAGRVVDERGAPVGDAEIQFAPADLRHALDLVLDTAALKAWKTRSDDRGAFAIADVPAVAGSSVWAQATAFQRTRVDAPLVARTDMELVLSPTDPATHLSGRVVDHVGAPVAGAHVALGRQATVTDRNGRFDLDLTGEGQGTRLRAVKHGLMPVTLACAKESPVEPGAWPSPLVMVLDEPAATIDGIVVDAGGKPVAGAQLAPTGRTHFGDVEVFFGAQSFYIATDVECLMGSGDRHASTRSDADGRFELVGLLAKEYRLRVFDPRTLQLTVTRPIAAGEHGVRIDLLPEPRYERLAGRVVDAAGRPLSGARVTLWRTSDEIDAHDTWDLTTPEIATDSDGRFEFLGVSRSVRSITAKVSGAVNGVTRTLADLPDLEHIVLMLARECHVRIESKNPSLVDSSFSFLGADGKPLVIYANMADVTAGGTRFGFDGKQSSVLTLSEAARTLVFFAPDEKEILRIPVELSPDLEINLLRP